MSSNESGSLLGTIKTPHQLRRLNDRQLQELADEMRETIIETVSRRGGHLASNLGMAELTIALHYVFDFTKDRLLWDVGHQCYPHKLLTGRYEKFDTLRQGGGLSGFPSPSESEYDLFSTGHAGTAISTAVGLAWADKQAGRDNRTVAMVGDASIVNGLSLEGLNNVARLERQFLVVLNDNSMGIAPTQGGLATTLDRVRLTHTYHDLRDSAERVLKRLPLGSDIRGALRNLKAGLQTTLHGGQVFEMLGLRYFGPVDGHNIGDLIHVFQALKDEDHPAILHVNTQKGRGCAYAVEDPCRFHSPSAYTVNSDGEAVFQAKERPSWTQAFAESLIEQAEQDERVVALTAAMPDGTGLAAFEEKFPERCIDVGINESHAVTMAAGMAKAGLKPVVAIYSTFMQRGFDQVFHDVALQDLPVVICMDRAGLVGSDGAVHHGAMDISFLRPIPGIVLCAPADAAEMNAAMKFALQNGRAVAMRYPRDLVPDDLPGDCPAFELGKARTIAEGKDATLLCYGTTVEPALRAARILREEEDLQVSVVNARFAKPLDSALIGKLIASGKPILCIEDHSTIGGFGSGVMEMAANRGLDASNVRLLGLPDRFIKHGSRDVQLTEVGLDATNISATIKEMIRRPAKAVTKHYWNDQS
ncbi:MAG: 1-deoxy-D-xylulose-5-phosphate synthase [Phycisphaerae bacterium]